MFNGLLELTPPLTDGSSQSQSNPTVLCLAVFRGGDFQINGPLLGWMINRGTINLSWCTVDVLMSGNKQNPSSKAYVCTLDVLKCLILQVIGTAWMPMHVLKMFSWMLFFAQKLFLIMVSFFQSIFSWFLIIPVI